MTTDRFRIDSHKLMYHPRRIADWREKKTTYPIYVEISPSGTCNHRCVFCSVDFMQYRRQVWDSGLLRERLSEMGGLGVKSAMFAGEGEPLLHRDIGPIIVHTRSAGIDAALTTNGVLLEPSLTETILASTAWIKVSCNAGSPETYAALHRTKAGDFDRVMSNLRAAVRIRAEQKAGCTLGLQILLLPENAHEVEGLALASRDMGLDYLVVKPYTHHVRNIHRYQIAYGRYHDLAERLIKINRSDFQVVFRVHTMEKWDAQTRPYARCLALPFWSYIDAEGLVWGCSAHLKDERFCYGSLYEQSFRQIWEGPRRAESLRMMEEGFDLQACKINCRMDEVNRYLWDLIHPPPHVNFI
jgi:MoaA/NifB/PqqE/SkfB family radical SAM enzyme